jgi:hypothetical protein
LLAIGLFAVREHRHRTEKGPRATASVPEQTETLHYVRLRDYEADLAALTRRIATLESDTEVRFQSLNGLFGNLKRQAATSTKDDLARVVGEAIAARNGTAPHPDADATGTPAVRRVKMLPGLRKFG